MAERFRFGIIGSGVIGPTHAAAIASLPDAVVAAVSDPIEERARKLADQYGVAAYDDPQAMLQRESLDVVCVCTPSGEHGAHAAMAMRAGCHVVVEKPLEITVERIDALLGVQRETGRKLAVISQHRFDPASVRVRGLVRDGALGRLVLGNALVPWWRTQGYYDSGAWRGTWALDGGGVLMNQSIHSVDLLQWLMGPVRSLHAYTDTLAHRMETEDVAVAVLRFESGALGTIAATTGGYPGTGTRIEVFGDRGSAAIETDALSYLHLAGDETSTGAQGGELALGGTPSTGGGTASDPAALSHNTHALQIADLIRAIREDGTPLVDGLAGRHPVAIIRGIYEAARTGKEVILS